MNFNMNWKNLADDQKAPLVAFRHAFHKLADARTQNEQYAARDLYLASLAPAIEASASSVLLNQTLDYGILMQLGRPVCGDVLIQSWQSLFAKAVALEPVFAKNILNLVDSAAYYTPLRKGAWHELAKTSGLKLVS